MIVQPILIFFFKGLMLLGQLKEAYRSSQAVSGNSILICVEIKESQFRPANSKISVP